MQCVVRCTRASHFGPLLLVQHGLCSRLSVARAFFRTKGVSHRHAKPVDFRNCTPGLLKIFHRFSEMFKGCAGRQATTLRLPLKIRKSSEHSIAKSVRMSLTMYQRP